MATVTLLQPTNMATMDSSMFAPSVYADTNEIGVSNQNATAYAFCGGSFVITSVNAVVGGTITYALIDDDDYGALPNLEIEGASFALSLSYFDDVFNVGNVAQLVSDLLSGNDQLTGSSGNDMIMGFAGNDTMIGGGGDNLFNGGSGIDTVSYAGASAGLFAGLEDAYANTGAALGDSYILVENLIGSAFNDFFYGTDDNNRFTGGAGNDQMVGKGGADTFDGGTGTDTAIYDATDPGIRADLLSPGTNTGDAIGDVYISVENLSGSSFDDILLGTNNANVIRGNHYPGLSGADQLFGRGGNDTLLGNDQNDRLIGGTGRDVMTGGAGADVFDFNAVSEMGTSATTRDRIIDFAHLTDDIDLSTIDANGGAAGNTAF
ncbi:MAG TPA: calcium-binding protein, partial [Nitrospiraceae bacterium]|nr:calcium-binding protein [Nitrospiraceae bacterium]